MRLSLAALALAAGLATMGAAAQAAPAAKTSGLAAQTQVVKAKAVRHRHVVRHKAHRKHVAAHRSHKVKKVAPKA